MRKLKSVAIVFGAALAVALLTSLVDKRLGFMVFFGVAASMGVGEVLAHRNRRKIAKQLSNNENALAQTVQTMQATLAAAQAVGDAVVIQAASRALAATGALLTDVRALKADVA